VCSFPGRESFTQISNAGGYEPLWAPDGKKLYYRDITGQRLMSVSFVSDPELYVGKPILLFQGKYSSGGGPWGRGYDITPDGKKFLMIEPEGGKSEVTQINIILNWFEELKQKVPND
jgi:Tol biopolymer transport system component